MAASEVHHLELQTKTVSEDITHGAVHWIPRIGMAFLIVLAFWIAAALAARAWPAVAGLGLTGFAVGFALRDIISNMLSGTLILFFQPFQIKDYIAVTGFEGTVINIELRYTILSKDGKYILIPNSSIFANPVVITPAKAPDVETPTRFEVT